VGSVKEDLEIMKKAQELDGEMYHLLEDLETLPEDRQNNKQMYETEKARLNDLEAVSKKLQLSQKEKEGQLSQKEANIKKLEGQLGQVKTNKEYTALQQEIASLKADNSLLEEEIIGILDEIEAAQDEVKKEKDRLKSCEKEFTQRETELTEKEKKVHETVEQIKSQRVSIINQLPPDVQTLYQKIVEHKKGLAVVKIQGEVCGACQLKLRPQVIDEVLLGKTLILCDNCSRILYSGD